MGLYIGKISDNKVDDVYDVIAEMNNVRELLNINDARFEFVPWDDDGKIDENSYKLQQVHNGVQVWCAQVVIIVDDEGYITGFTSNYVDYARYSGVETEPTVTMSDAIDIAIETTEVNEGYEIFTEAELIVEPDNGLLWYVVVSTGDERWWYWIDAIDGKNVCKQTIGNTFFNLDLDTYTNLKDETFTLWGATVNLISFDDNGTTQYQLYDRTVYTDKTSGISVHDMKNAHVTTKDYMKVHYPGEIYKNTDNNWNVNDFSQRQALYASYNFNRVINQYKKLDFNINEPIEVNVNLHLQENAAYCGTLSSKDAIRFIFGNYYLDENKEEHDYEITRQLDTVGHEYTHMVQDYYVNPINSTHWTKNGSLGNAYSLQNSSNLDWVESKGISEGTADIMGMLIEAICEGNIDDDGRIADIDSFLLYGESGDGRITRNHTATNTKGNNDVDEMIQYYQNNRYIELTKEWNGNPVGAGGIYTLAKIDELEIPEGSYTIDFLSYGQGPGHYDGYIVVGILRDLVDKTDLTIEQYLELWYTTITMLNPLSEFDSLRFSLFASAEKIGLGSYIDDIIDACVSVGITGNQHHSAEYNTWYYKGLAKAYNNGIIAENEALNNATDIVTRYEYLELLAAMCEKVGVDVDSDAVAWAKALEVIGYDWTGDYLNQSIPCWQATLLMYQIFNQYHKEFNYYGWKVVYGYEFVSESGTDRWQNFKNVQFDDWDGRSVTGINVSEMLQYYRGCAVYSVDTKQLSDEKSIKAFQEQYMASKSTSKTYVTGANDEDTQKAMYYMGFYQLWSNGMFHGYSSSGKIKLGTTDSMSLGEVCALITQVIPD